MKIMLSIYQNHDTILSTRHTINKIITITCRMLEVYIVKYQEENKNKKEKITQFAL